MTNNNYKIKNLIDILIFIITFFGFNILGNIFIALFFPDLILVFNNVQKIKIKDTTTIIKLLIYIGISSSFNFILSSLFLRYLVIKESKFITFDYSKNFFRKIPNIFFIALALVFANLVLLKINRVLVYNFKDFFYRLILLDNKIQYTYDVFLSSKSIIVFLFGIFFLAIVPAIGEELFFRQTLLKHIFELTSNFWISNIIVSIFFGIIHLQISSLIPRIFVSLFFGYIYNKHQNILSAIFLHLFHNFLIISFYFFKNI